MKDSRKISIDILNFTKRIVERTKPEKVILFGSYAWGTPGANSDIDLFIVADSSAPRIQREKRLYQDLFPSGVAADMLWYTPNEVAKRQEVGDPFIKDIADNGMVLYDARKE